MPFYTEQDRNFVQALKTKGYSKDDALAELDKQKARTAPTVPAVSDIASSISGMAEKGLVTAHDSTPHELGVLAMGAQQDLAKREQMKTDIALVNNVSGPKDNPNYFGQVANAYNQGNETINKQADTMAKEMPVDASNPLTYGGLFTPVAKVGAQAFNLVNAPLAPIFSALQKGYEDTSKGLMSNEDKQSLKEYQDKGLKGIEILMQAEVDGTQNPELKAQKQAELDKYLTNTRALENNPNYQIGSLTAKSAGGYAAVIPAVEGVDISKMDRPIGEVPTSYGGTPPGGTPMTVEELAARPDFNAKLNKALPPTKNDVRDIGARSNAAATVITDIAKNKDTLGLVDEAGNPRLPSGKNVFQETVQAQDARTADLYKSYTEKLTGVDKAKFSDDINGAVANQTKIMEEQLARENSAGTRAALERKITELKTLRDTSPKGIQDYVQTLNRETKTAPGAPLTPDQVQSANLAGSMRKVLDESVGKIDGPGYQAERNIYGAHRQMQDAFLRAAAKEIRNTPGLTEKLANMGLTVEGINYLLTHNPSSLVTGLGFKAAVEFVKRINSPGAAMEGLFKMADQGLVNPEMPQATIPTATNISNAPIDSTLPQPKGKVKPFSQSETTQTTQALVEQAKKYKTAEQFVKGTQTLFEYKYDSPLKYVKEKTGLDFKTMNMGDRLYVLKDGQEIGRITAGRVHDFKGGMDELAIGDIFIEEKYRGNDYGTSIVKAFKEYADKTGLPLYATEVLNDSAPYWKKLGFDTPMEKGAYGTTGNAVYKPSGEYQSQLTDIWNKAR